MLKRAFTLVELMVVIAGIALLIALLLPALRQAREVAKMAVCASNLRQCGIGALTYATDSNQHVPVKRQKNGAVRSWPHFLTYGNTTWDQPHGTLYIARGVSVCPANPFYAQDVKIATSTNVAYAMFLVGGTTQPVFSASSFQQTIPMLPTPAPPNDDWMVQLQRLSHLPTPTGTTIWMADSLSMHGSSYGGGGHNYGNFCDQQRANYDGAIHTLHPAQRANALFYDGHVNALTDTQMRNDTATRVRYFYPQAGGYYALP